MKVFILFALFAASQAALLAGAPALLSAGGSTQYRSQDNIGNYAFGYNEGHLTGGTFRKESGDAFGNKIGSYGLRDADGRLRIVNYVADAAGFRADIKTNEPGVEPKDPAYTAINKHNVLVAAPAVHAVSYAAPAPIAKISPITYAAPAPIAKFAPITYAAPAPIAKIAPITYAAPAPIAKIAPITYAAPAHVAKFAPITYAAPAPIAKFAPITYAAPAPISKIAPITYAAPAPIAKIAPISYSARPIAYANTYPFAGHNGYYYNL